jgi:hypothetical protein
MEPVEIKRDCFNPKFASSIYLQKHYSNLVLCNNTSLRFYICAKGTLLGQTKKSLVETQDSLPQLVLLDIGQSGFETKRSWLPTRNL